MPLDIKPIKEAYKDQGLKILVFGPSGVGKTVLCTTIPKDSKGLLLSAEAGLLSVKDSEMDSQAIDSMSVLKEVYGYLREEEPYDWILIDSISEIGEVLLANEKAKTRDPRQAYGVLIDELTKVIRKFRDLPRANVVMTCKQERIINDKSQMLFSPSLPGAKLGQQIPYFFDEVFALRIIEKEEGEKPVRVLQTSSDIQYNCKDRSGKLTPLVKPSLSFIYEQIHSGS